MKVNDIMNERFGDEYRYHRSIGFDKKLRALKNFIRQTNNEEAIQIYKQASQDGKFAPEDIQRLKQIMR